MKLQQICNKKPWSYPQPSFYEDSGKIKNLIEPDPWILRKGYVQAGMVLDHAQAEARLIREILLLKESLCEKETVP